jgi:hypothetical protein
MSVAIADQLFLAYMGRAADTQWRSSTATLVTNMGGNPTKALKDAFYSAGVAEGVYAASDSPSTVVNKFFVNTFGFTARTDEQTFWGNLLANGTYSAGELIWQMFSSYLNNASALPATYQVPVQSKLVALAAFSNALTDATQNAAYSQVGSAAAAVGRTYLSGVTSQATAATAINGVAATISAGAVVAGNTFTLTTGVDITSFSGTMVGAESATDAADTLNTGDTLTGTGSADVLRAIIADADNPVLTLTGVETVRLEATAAATLNAQSWSGLTTLQVANAGLLNTTTLLTTVQNLRSNATLSLENVGVQTSLDNALAVTYANGSVGSTGTLTIAGNGAGGWNADGGTAVLAGIAITGNNEVFTKVVLNSTGTNRVEIEAAAADDFNLSEIVVTGSGATSLDFATAVVTGVTTVNLSAASGAITLVDALGTGTVNVTVTGGSGADTMTVDATNQASVSLGAGNDVLTINNATSALILSTDLFDLGGGTGDVVVMTGALAAALDDADAADTLSLSRIQNYERLRLSDGLTADLDAAPFGVSYFSMNANGTADTNLNNVANNSTIEFRAAYANEMIVNVLTPAGNDDVINLSLNGNLAANANLAVDIRLPGIDTINVTTADRANADNATDRTEGYVLSVVDGDDSTLDTLNIAGTQFLSYTATATSTISTVNASTSTGDLTINLALIIAGEGATITGSTGTNTLTGTGIADTIIGGARADSITGGLGGDTMTGGGAADVYVIDQDTGSEAAVVGVALSAGFDTITDFGSDDTIDLTAGTVAGAAAGPAVAATTVVISAAGKVTFAAADDTLAEMITALAADDVNLANAEVAFFTFGADTYVYGAGADTTAAADDFVIKLAGVTSFTTLSVAAGNVFSLS